MTTTAPAHTSSSSNALAAWSTRAQEGLRRPPHRGTFRPLDAARRQLGLLSAADDHGQARIYWLVDLHQQRIVEARFLAYGALTSHPLAEAWCQLVEDQRVTDACALDPLACEQALRDEPSLPAFAEDPEPHCAFISDLQRHALAALPSVKLLPKPVEVERYQRKREQDWNEDDRAWLPLSLMKKLMKVQKVGDEVLRERSGHQVAWTVEGLHEDFQVRAQFSQAASDEIPTLIAFLGEGLQARIHPQITVEEAAHE